MRFTLFDVGFFMQGFDLAICQINEDRALLGFSYNSWTKSAWVGVLYFDIEIKMQ